MPRTILAISDNVEHHEASTLFHRFAAPSRATQRTEDEFSEELFASVRSALWRRYNDAIVHDFVATRATRIPPGSVLKTDLFEEALGIDAFAKAIGGLVGMDQSAAVVGAAGRCIPDIAMVRADVRRLPFGDAVFSGIVSTSTLDHFRGERDLDAALVELGRVVRPGGMLILTLDNPVNPLLAIRNAIPHKFRRLVRLTPYFVGYTCGPGPLRRRLRHAGFEPIETVALLHFPRVIVAVLGSLVRALGREAIALRLPPMLAHAEVLRHVPTRWLTGHYIAVVAKRRP